MNKVFPITLLLLITFTTPCSANTEPSYEYFLKAQKERRESYERDAKLNKNIIESLRHGVSDINSKAPIDYGNDVFMTSSSITDNGLMTMRFIMKSNTRFQINPKLISEELVNLACTTKSIYSGIDAGVTAKVLLTTVDGFDVESGPISKSTCAKYK